MVHRSTLPMPQGKNTHQPCKPFLPFHISQGRHCYNKLHEKHAGKTSFGHFFASNRAVPLAARESTLVPCMSLLHSRIRMFSPLLHQVERAYHGWIGSQIPQHYPTGQDTHPSKPHRDSPEAIFDLGLHVREPSERILTA